MDLSQQRISGHLPRTNICECCMGNQMHFGQMSEMPRQSFCPPVVLQRAFTPENWGGAVAKSLNEDFSSVGCSGNR